MSRARFLSILILCWLPAGSAAVEQVGTPHRFPAGQLKSRPHQSILIDLITRSEGLSPGAREYLAALADLAEKAGQDPGEAESAERMGSFLAGQVAGLGPIVFFSRYPLGRPSAAASAIGQSVPERWGCSIRVYDPARPDRPPQSIFHDAEGSIFDMDLSWDAKTLFFSHKSRNQECWQIYEIGTDGRGLQKISRDPACCDVSPVELPDGRLLYVSTRCGGYLLSEPGPCSNLHVMNRDGSGVRPVSQNTLADLSPCVLPDGRVLLTRWEYVDRDLDHRQGLWTQHPDGRQFQLFFGNTIREVDVFWQARPVPGHENLVVATFAPHQGWPHGAIGLIQNRLGQEAPRDCGFAWITQEFPEIGDSTIHTDGVGYDEIAPANLLDLMIREEGSRREGEVPDLSTARELEAQAGSWLDSLRWSYRDPFPVNDYQFLVAYGGGGRRGRFGLFLLDLCDNKIPVYSDPRMGCYGPLLLVPRTVPPRPAPLSKSMSRQKNKTSWAVVLVIDVYRGLPTIKRGRAQSIQIMEQIRKTHDATRRAYDQAPLIGYGTYYAKRCWGRVPVAPDGSAHFRVPALREIYLQILDAQGRELQRQTSAIQLAPGEVRSCIGCHEPRNTAPAAGRLPMAARRPPSQAVLPRWAPDGIIGFDTAVQPVLTKYCVECHAGPDPAAGCDLSADKTRLFSMAYDNLLGRSRSYRQHNLSTGEMLSQEAARGKPLVHFYWLARTPTAVNRPLWTGSNASRLLEYIDTDHCGRMIPPEDRRRIYVWIDANVPYYATYAHSRPHAPGGRDLCTDAASGRESEWYARRFLGTYKRRCVCCHGDFPHPNDHRRIWSGRYAWINFSHPRWSPALTVHLAREAGGRGLGTMPGGRGTPLFADTTDPDYLAMLGAIREGRLRMLACPRVDIEQPAQ